MHKLEILEKLHGPQREKKVFCFSDKVGSDPCANPGILPGGGVQALLPENSSDKGFYSGLSMVYFKENYHFPRFQRGSNIFQGVGGGPSFSRGGGVSNFFRGV